MESSKTEMKVLLAVPDGYVHELTTLEMVDQAMADLMAYWKVLPEDDVKTKLAAVAYAKLMIRRKAFTPNIQKPVNGSPEYLTALDESKLLLTMEIEQIDFLVKENEKKTLSELLHMAFGQRRKQIADVWATKLSQAEFNSLMDQVDVKIATKIKIRLEGSSAAMYQQAYEKARLKYGWETQAQETTVPIPPPKPKKKKKADAPPKMSIWMDVMSALAMTPLTFPVEAFRAKPLHFVSSQVVAMMQPFFDEERKRWQSEGIECSAVLLRHNFLTLLLNESTWKPLGQLAVTARDGKTWILVEEEGRLRLWLQDELFEAPMEVKI